jgi:hypothetical protein
MITSDGSLRRAAIRRTLSPVAECGSDADCVVEITIDTWRQLAGHLTPVIGARGVDVLFKRSLHVTSRDYPWLARAGEGGDVAAQSAVLRARFEARDPATAVAASYALLVTFTELLAGMIGGSLTDRLLDPVWAPPSPGHEQERHDE